MALALYRKYRPQSFADITGQNHVKITLANQIASGKVAHAYLFTGPRGVGKTSTARILAKAVNCETRAEGASEPCNACAACLDIAAGKALDVLEIDAASNTGVENVRENIIESVRFTPSKLKNKIFIIDEVHMLSVSAFNALLKTLEEPPAHAMFILATTELHKVPQTILSRCQRFDFRTIPTQDLIERLARLAAGEGRDVAPEVFALIARASGGSLRDAESTLEQILSVTGGAIGTDEASLVLPRSDIPLALRYVTAAIRRTPGDAFAVVAEIQEESVDPVRFTDDCLLLLRAMLLTSLERDASAIAGQFDAETEKAALRLAGEAGTPRIAAAIDVLLRTRRELKTADAGLLPLELAAVDIAEGAGSKEQAPVTKTPPPPQPVAGSQSPVEKAPPTVVPTADRRPPTALPPVDPPKKVRKGGKALTTTLEMVQREWQAFIRAVGEMNHSLPFILTTSSPVRIENGTLVIGSRYPFHCGRMNEEKHYRILAAACEQVFGEEMDIRAEVSDIAPADAPGDVAPLTAAPDADPALKAILDALGGGQVVKE